MIIKHYFLVFFWQFSMIPLKLLFYYTIHMTFYVRVDLYISIFSVLIFIRLSLLKCSTFNALHFLTIQLNSIQDYLYRAFHETIVAKQLYIKLSFYNRFIYSRNLIYVTYGKMWLILYTVWGVGNHHTEIII